MHIIKCMQGTKCGWNGESKGWNGNGKDSWNVLIPQSSSTIICSKLLLLISCVGVV
jgi:hypothetical protein